MDTIESLRMEVIRLDTENSRLVLRLDEARTEISTLKRALEKRDRDVESLERMLDEAQERTSKLEGEATSNMNRLGAEIADLRNKLDEAESKLELFKVHADRLQGALDESRRSNAELVKALREMARSVPSNS